MPSYQPQFGYAATWAAQHSPQQTEPTGANSPVPAHGIQYPSQNQSPHAMHPSTLQGQYIITQPGVAYPNPAQFGHVIAQPDFITEVKSEAGTEENGEVAAQQVQYQQVVQHEPNGMIYQPLNHYYIDPQHHPTAPPSQESEVQHLVTPIGTPPNVENYDAHPTQLEHPQHSPTASHHSPGAVHFKTDYSQAEASPDFQNNINHSSSSEYASVSSEMQSI